MLDRWGRPFPEPDKHRRAAGFTATTVPLKDDEEVIHGITPPRSYEPDPIKFDHDPMQASAARQRAKQR